MRIVNLDKMLEQINPFKSSFNEYLYNSVETLGEACKVEAIPIEWLRRHGAHLVTMPKRKFDSSNMAFLFTLIKDWEDENGTENY